MTVKLGGGQRHQNAQNGNRRHQFDDGKACVMAAWTGG